MSRTRAEIESEIMSLLRDNIRNIVPYSTARDDCKAKMDIYLDANENPFDTGVNRYPSPHQPKLKKMLSVLKKIPEENIFTGNGSDEPIEMQAAVNYINARRFMEALNTLYSIPEGKRSGRWYFLSAYAKAHTGDTVGAGRDIEEAIRREPGNMSYHAFRDNLTGRRTAYSGYTQNYSANTPGGICSSLCLSLLFFRFCFCFI